MDRISFKTLALAQKFSEDMVGGLFDNFSETQSYQKGELVLYNHILYQFTANKSAGAWDSSKAEVVNLSDILELLNTKFYTKEEIDNLIGQLQEGYDFLIVKKGQ